MGSLVNKNSLFPSMNSFFDDVFSKDFFDWNDKNYSSLGSTLPSVNLMENDSQITIDLAAPGMKKEDFKIDIDGNMLTISSEKEETKEEKEKKFTRKEYNYTSFSRSFTLPDEVNKEKIDAKYEDGVLKISLPRKEEVKKPAAKQIAVK